MEETAPESQSAAQEGGSGPSAEIQLEGAVPEEPLAPPVADHQEPEAAALDLELRRLSLQRLQSSRTSSSGDETEPPPPTDVPSPTEEPPAEGAEHTASDCR